MLFAAGVAQCLATLAWADAMQRMSGPAIKTRFSDMNFTDEVHWSFRFERDGRILGTSMSKHFDGRWDIKGRNICVTNGPGGDGCFEVWTDGSRVELRREDDLPIEGVLQRK